MDIDPIQNQKTWLEKALEKFKEFGRQFKNFKKPKKPDYEELLKRLDENNKKVVYNMNKFGMSCEEAGKALMKFNEVLTPNKMREICDLKRIEDGETTLYADGKPYCIINRKGDIVWQKQIL